MDSKSDLLGLIARGVAISIFLCTTSLPASAQWVNYPTTAIPRTADGRPNLTAPAPRTADGKPDFSGVWIAEDQKYFMNLATGLKPEDVQLQPCAAALQKERVDRNHDDDPLAHCLPHGVPRGSTHRLLPPRAIEP